MNDLVLQIIAHLHVNMLSFYSRKFPYIKMETTEVHKTSLCMKYVKCMIFVHTHVI